MACYRETVRLVDRFDRKIAGSATVPDGPFGWIVADTSSSGTPTYASSATEDGGAIALTLANTNEVENVCLYQGDILPYDLTHIQHFRTIVKVGSVSNTCVITWGLGNARADDEDSVTVAAWFKMEGATSTTAVVAEYDDGTNTEDDVATGVTQADTYKEYAIDFTNGLSDIRYYVDGARVATGTTFKLSSITAGQNVQVMYQISKTASTSTPSLYIAHAEVQYEAAYGA